MSDTSSPEPCDELRPIPQDARCQEASPFSREVYIACNAPAVAIVRHDKDRRSYYMCLPCADHNLKNRGGKLVSTTNVELLSRFDCEKALRSLASTTTNTTYDGRTKVNVQELLEKPKVKQIIAEINKNYSQQPEYELPACAAVRDNRTYAVVADRRHGDCLSRMNALQIPKDCRTQGFVTNRGRFVDRREAFRLMQAAGIPSAAEGGYRGEELYSEDLY